MSSRPEYQGIVNRWMKGWEIWCADINTSDEPIHNYQLLSQCTISQPIEHIVARFNRCNTCESRGLDSFLLGSRKAAKKIQPYGNPSFPSVSLPQSAKVQRAS